jgi:peptidoglycan-associated lipoprotein
MKKLILSVLLLNLLAACGSNPPKETAAEPATTSAATAPQSAPDAGAATASNAQADADAQAAAKAKAAADAEAAMLKKNSVYFPFDVDAVQDADRETIMNHAAYLAKNPGLKVRIEGNADERGSSEYNLGLGQRRANNTKKALVLGGAQASQIETISYGEEKPRCTEHNEACWAQNRRADINYSAR